MENKNIYILGAGNLAKDVIGIYKELGKSQNLKGLIEENCQRQNNQVKGIEIFDDSIINSLDKNSIFIGAIGLPNKENFIKKVELKGFDFDILLHSAAIIGKNVKIGKGCIIFVSTILTRDIKIGSHTIINTNSSISHDCKIGDFVTISPGVNIAGNVTIGDGCWIGIGATIVNNVSIGKGSLIGAGAVVTKDISENTLAVGLPAKPVKKMSESNWKKLI